MPSELTSPLTDIIKRAAQLKCSDSPIAKLKQRFEGCSDITIVVCDVSASMEDLIGSQGMTKHEHLQIALRDVLLAHPQIKILAFASYPKFVSATEFPVAGSLGGSTDLAKAIDFAAKLKPKKTIIISDGLPESQESALAAADAITGQVDTIYCGPDSHPAVDFLRRLAKETGGVQITWDGYKQEISSAIRGLLTA